MWYAWITCVNNFKLQSRFVFLSLWRFFCCVTTMLSMLLLQQPNLRYFLYFQVTHKSKVVPICFLVCHLWHTLHLWQLNFSKFLKAVSLILLEMRCLLVRSNYLRHNYFIYLFVVVTIFYDVTILFYFGTFELHMEITL